LVVISVDVPMVQREVKDGLGATFQFLSDADKKVITELDIVDTSDPVHGPVAIPYTFVLDRDRTIYTIYNGWWFLGRPTVEQLRMDFRALMSGRADWWYDKTPPPYAVSKSESNVGEVAESYRISVTARS
jgi:AhpC/TSA family